MKIDQKAKIYLSRICQTSNSDYIRLEVKAGGCAGLKFEWYNDTNAIPEKTDTLLELTPNYHLVLDEHTNELLKDSELVMERTISGSNLKINNPNSKSKCGCGLSFGV